MNKNIKGLIVYLLLMSIIWTFPFLVLYFFFGALYYDNSTLLVILYLLQTIAFFILYFILPVILTYFAIKKHWSKYLDRFFLHKWWPTILLLFFIFLHSTEHIFIKFRQISDVVYLSDSHYFRSIYSPYILFYLLKPLNFQKKTTEIH